MEEHGTTALASSKLVVKLAESPDEILETYRLRYRVYAEEHQTKQLMNSEGIEKDVYDDYCDHLIVKDLTHGRVAGTYRLMPGSRAGAAGFYTETEFALNRFRQEIPRTVELGRLCVDPDYRSNRVMMLLWGGMLQYFARPEFEYIFGCASMQLDNRHDLNVIYSWLCRQTFDIDRFGIEPLASHKVNDLQLLEDVDDKLANRKMPSTIKGYLQMGSDIVREPIYDPVFDTYDFCVVLEKSKVTPLYRRRFMQTVL